MASVFHALASAPLLAHAPSKHLLEFRAGKLVREGNALVADARKGLVFLDVGGDALLHLFWKDRSSNVVEDDLIIFPEEAELAKIEQSAERVLVLKFKSSSQKHFFWMQEPTTDDDEKLRLKVNAIINDPSAVHGDNDEGESQQDEMLRAMQQSLASASSTAHPNTGSANEQDSAQMNAIRNILANIQVPQGERIDIDLSDVLTSANVQTLLRNSSARTALFPHLPENAPHTPEEIDDVVRSPQFRQSLHTLSYALRSGQLAPLLNSLGLTSTAVTGNLDNVKAFLRAIASQVGQSDTSADTHVSRSMDTSQ